MKKFWRILSHFWKIVKTHPQPLSLLKRGEKRNPKTSSSSKYPLFTKERLMENRNPGLSNSSKFPLFIKDCVRLLTEGSGEFSNFRISSFLTIFLIISSLFCCTFSEIRVSSKKNTGLPDEEGDSVKIISMTKDIIDYELTAPHIDRFYKKKLTFADSIFLTTYNPDGSIKSTLASDKAEMDEAKNILTAIDNVVVETENGIMKTPFLIWNKNTDELHAKKEVILIREDNVLRGLEMKTDGNLERIEIIKVSAEGKIDENEIDW